MNALALTVFVGAVLVSLFVLLFILQALSGSGSRQSDALLPLRGDDNQPPQS